MRKLALLSIKFYKRFISPYLPDACRYYPTCSEYTYIAIEKHGFFKGIFLGFKRILKCQPFYKGGVDLVPEKFSFKEQFKLLFWRNK